MIINFLMLVLFIFVIAAVKAKNAKKDGQNGDAHNKTGAASTNSKEDVSLFDEDKTILSAHNMYDVNSMQHIHKLDR